MILWSQSFLFPRTCVIKLLGRRRKYLETSHNACGATGNRENKGQTKCCTLGFGAHTSCTSNDFLELTALLLEAGGGKRMEIQ